MKGCILLLCKKSVTFFINDTLRHVSEPFIRNFFVWLWIFMLKIKACNLMFGKMYLWAPDYLLLIILLFLLFQFNLFDFFCVFFYYENLLMWLNTCLYVRITCGESLHGDSQRTRLLYFFHVDLLKYLLIKYILFRRWFRLKNRKIMIS